MIDQATTYGRYLLRPAHPSVSAVSPSVRPSIFPHVSSMLHVEEREQMQCNTGMQARRCKDRREETCKTDKFKRKRVSRDEMRRGRSEKGKKAAPRFLFCFLTLSNLSKSMPVYILCSNKEVRNDGGRAPRKCRERRKTDACMHT